MDDRGLVVMAPYRCSDTRIDKMLQDGAGWIRKKLAHWQASAPPTRHWHSGALVDYLGQQLTLEILPGPQRAQVQLMDGGRLELRLAGRQQGL